MTEYNPKYSLPKETLKTRQMSGPVLSYSKKIVKWVIENKQILSKQNAKQKGKIKIF